MSTYSSRGGYSGSRAQKPGFQRYGPPGGGKPPQKPSPKPHSKGKPAPAPRTGKRKAYFIVHSGDHIYFPVKASNSPYQGGGGYCQDMPQFFGGNVEDDGGHEQAKYTPPVPGIYIAPHARAGHETARTNLVNSLKRELVEESQSTLRCDNLTHDDLILLLSHGAGQHSYEFYFSNAQVTEREALVWTDVNMQAPATLEWQAQAQDQYDNSTVPADIAPMAGAFFQYTVIDDATDRFTYTGMSNNAAFAAKQKEHKAVIKLHKSMLRKYATGISSFLERIAIELMQIGNATPAAMSLHAQPAPPAGPDATFPVARPRGYNDWRAADCHTRIAFEIVARRMGPGA